MKRNLVFLTLLGTAVLLSGCGGNTPASSSEQAASSSSPAPASSTTVSSQESSAPACSPVKADEKVHLVILAGQSGARGKALVSSLTDEQKAELPSANVDILADGMMMAGLSNIPTTPSQTAMIQPVNKGFGDTAGEFGPELGMAETLASVYPKNTGDYRSIIIKYTASGSTFYDHWQSSSLLEDTSITTNTKQVRTNPVTGKLTGPLTNNLYQLIDMAKSQLTGYDIVVDGCVFVHGEQDAKYDANMGVYQKALEYFIKDLRSYVGNENMPFVITEALTNAAKYSNELRSIEKTVAEKTANCGFVDTSDLKTNSFEPWHFGPAANFELGNRAAAELIARVGDPRKIVSFADSEAILPLNGTIALPPYRLANFEDNLTGYVKVKYDTYDSSKVGDVQINYAPVASCPSLKGKVTGHIANLPYIDGDVSDAAYGTAKDLPNNLGSIKVAKADNGLYVAANITDTEIWSDGEAWATGDMGQYGNDDDLEIFLVDGEDPSTRYSFALSSGNLLRVYQTGTVFPTATAQTLLNNNLYYHRMADNFNYKTITKGLTNGEAGEGMTMEVFISYDDLGVVADNLKICFKYSNVSGTSEGTKVTKTEQANYLTKASGTETAIASYFALSEI